MKKNKFIEHFLLPKNFYSVSQQTAPNINFAGVSLPEKTIYLDFAASTPLDLRVYNEMTPWFLSYFANAANRIHPMGELTEHALAWARTTVANVFHVTYEEIIFTSSASESNNLLLRGLIENPLRKRNKIIYCATEHSSIATIANVLSENYNKTLGIQVEILPVNSSGQVDIEVAKQLIDQNTLCVCVMDVNNETGIVQLQLPQIKELTQKFGAILHIDSAQGFARLETPFCGVDFDTATISSSKIYGPKGAATLIIKKRHPRIRIAAQIVGGGHEFNLRSGTPNIPAIVGFAHACLLQQKEAKERINFYAELENAFRIEISKSGEAHFYGTHTQKVPGILMLNFPGVNAMKLLENTKNVCASVGSACQSLQATASHVLIAMGVDLEKSLASFRVSFGLTNSVEEVQEAARRLLVEAKKLKEDSATLI